MKGRLNAFQSAMLRWREMYPYIAVHVVRVDATLDRRRLHDAIDGQLAFAGLAGLVLDRRHRRYEYRGGPPVFELVDVQLEGGADETLRAEIERQLNRSFPAEGRIEPFRFFVIPGQEAFRLGLAYDHFVAGGDSIVGLLNDIVDRYRGAPTDPVPPRLYPPSLRTLVGRNATQFVRGLGWLSKAARSCRHGLRPRYSDASDQYNEFRFLDVAPPAMSAMLAKAKQWQVTFNDLMIAVILFSMSPHLPERSSARRRPELSVASIVNLRGEFGFGPREVFGQFLSSMRIAHRVPAGATLESIARDVHVETERIKSHKLYLQTLVAVRANAMVWRFLDVQHRRRLYAKVYPVQAGVTSLNVNALWRTCDGGSVPADYLRAVPTGPLAPLVVAVTTSADVLHLGVSYRRTSFDRAKVDRILESMTDCIRSLQ